MAIISEIPIKILQITRLESKSRKSRQRVPRHTPTKYNHYQAWEKRLEVRILGDLADGLIILIYIVNYPSRICFYYRLIGNSRANKMNIDFTIHASKSSFIEF